MANTVYLKTIVEDHVREWLRERFGQPFKSLRITLAGVQGQPRDHEFDAVSEDRAIVCSIKTASWTTSGNKRGSGKVHGVWAELYFLNLVDASQKFLILTDPEFFKRFHREAAGRLVNGVELINCPLPDEIYHQLDLIRAQSRSELGFGES